METAVEKLPKQSHIVRNILLLVLGILFAGLSFGISIILQKVQQFTKAGHTSIQEMYQLARTVQNTPPPWKDGAVTILLLGTDAMENRGSDAVLTDTMILASLHKAGPEVYLYSIPRDVWSDAYKTKINALYAYGKTRYPGEPERFTREVLTELTGVSPQYTIMLDMTTVEEIINTIGGIEVNVTDAFTDTQFPREDVDVRVERDPAKLYKTVQFEAGPQWMDGRRAMEFIRSRHSIGEQGTDTARGARQQQVLMALLSRIQNPRLFLQQPQLAGALYNVYLQKFQQSFPIKDLGAIALDLRSTFRQLTIHQATASVFPQNPQGVLEHPKNAEPYQNQWVYIIRNPATFQAEVQQQLGMRTPETTKK